MSADSDKDHSRKSVASSLQKTVMGEGLEQRFLYHFKSDKFLNSALLSPEGLFPRSTMTLVASFSSSTLPPHRPYDCAINLLPGAPLPSSWLYNLFRPEWEAMESYLSESLVSMFIRPLSSPIGVGFFLRQEEGRVPTTLHRPPGAQPHYHQK